MIARAARHLIKPKQVQACRRLLSCVVSCIAITCNAAGTAGAVSVWENDSPQAEGRTEAQSVLAEAIALNRQALEQQQARRPTEAEALYKRSIAGAEKALGQAHPGLAAPLSNLASLYQTEGRFREAERLHERSLALLRTLSEPTLLLGVELNNLGMLYVSESRYSEAADLFRQSLSVLELRLGPENPGLAAVLSNLGAACSQLSSYHEAELLFRRSLAIVERAEESTPAAKAKLLQSLHDVLLQQGRVGDADAIEERIRALRENVAGR